MTDHNQLPPRTRRFAATLRIAALAAMALLILATGFVLLNGDLLIDTARRHLLPQGMPLWPVSRAAWLVLAVLALISCAIILFTLWQMAQLFAAYAAGEAFTPRAARATRRIGLGLVAQGLWAVLGHTLTGLALSIDAPAGHRVLALRLGSSDGGFILAGALLLLIGVVMQQANALKAENEGFV